MFFLGFLFFGGLFVAALASTVIFGSFLFGDTALVLVGGILAAFGFVLLV